jgi:hypothetical protein
VVRSLKLEDSAKFLSYDGKYFHGKIKEKTALATRSKVKTKIFKTLSL